MVRFYVINYFAIITLLSRGVGFLQKPIADSLLNYMTDGVLSNMCTERDAGSAARERPVDRPGICCCSVPESVQVVLRRIQILSFDPCTIGVTGSRNSVEAVEDSSPSDAMAA